MTGKIHILTEAVHTGKTTALKEWATKKPNIAGILAPDIDGRRFILNLSNNELLPFQVNENETREAITPICDYRFLTSSFERAKDIIKNAVVNVSTEWVVIDEVGKLELKGQGLGPAVEFAIKKFKCGEYRGNLLLVVRDTLLNETFDYYEIENASILRKQELSSI